MAFRDLDSSDLRGAILPVNADIPASRGAHLRIVGDDELPVRDQSVPDERLPPGSTRPEAPSFDELYRRYFADARRSLALLGVPAAHLDDAAQDVFLVVHRRLDDFEGRSSVRTWVLGIARRVASQYRRRGFREWRRRDAWARELEESTTYLEGALANREAAEVLEAFLDTLSEPQREAFVLGAVQGLTRREMAEALGISPNTAASRLRLARQRFSERVLDPEAQELLLLDWRARKANRGLVARARALFPVLFAGGRGAGFFGQLSLFGKAAVVSGALLGSVLAAGAMELDASAPPAKVVVAPVEAVEATVAGERRGPGTPRAERETELVEVDPAERLMQGADVSPPPRSRSIPRANATAPADATEDLSQLKSELSILQRAQDAYRAGRHDGARAALRAHRAAHPHGRLSIDRDFLDALLTCEGADAQSARAVQASFAQRYPGTVQASRLGARCTPAPQVQRPGQSR